MQKLALRLSAIAVDLGHRAAGQRGQATVEYVGLVVVLGTGIGMIVAGLDTLGFVTKIGGKLIKGVTGALDKIMPG
ncbi:MAG: hypothetical protein JJE27_09105 [Thermoleophilia bacterium]|nr:hypothetical protein [Thermoleophilia bacterium]